MANDGNSRAVTIWGGNNQHRLLVYDYVRIIATIMVVIGHSRYLSIHSDYGFIDYSLPETIDSTYSSFLFNAWEALINWIASFHMPLFAMLSGAVFTVQKIDQYDIFIKKKINRLLLPYYFYGCVFMIPIKLLSGFYAVENIPDAVNAFLSGTEGSHLWFLPAIFWCIIIFATLKRVLQKMGVYSEYANFFIVSVIWLFRQALPIDVLGLKWGLDYMIYFGIGYIFERERNRIKIKPTARTLFAHFALLISICILNEKYKILNSFIRFCSILILFIW